MVRINLLHPNYLTDQHLIAEYNEILMLVGFVQKFPLLHLTNTPKEYTLGKGHINFFKNKLTYIKDRHNQIKKEMIKRKFKPTKTLTLNHKSITNKHKNNYKPTKQAKQLIKQRLKQKIKAKPKFYRYYQQNHPLKFLIELIDKSD